MNWYKKAQSEEPEEYEDIQSSDETSIDDIPKKNRGGDCYEISGRYLMDEELKGDDSLILVHGEVTGQGPIAGVKYGHAWIEKGEMVIDMSQGRNIQLPKFLYYSLGNIDESKIFKYDHEQMRKKVLEHEHWGPWDLNTRL